ncbi:NTP transferase domain-containing protein [Rubritalea tangerina]
MGQNKAQLIYRDDTPEWLRLHSLLSAVCQSTFLSHPEDQDFGVPYIADPADGPLAAIHAAQAAHPGARWLVLACDLPLLDSETLQNLVEHSNQTHHATGYLSRIDQRIEPLCSIYEPSSRPHIEAALKANTFCPRSVLESLDTHTLTLPNPHALDNANSPADALEVRSHLTQTRSKKSVQIQYFAQLRELAQCDSESITTECVTASGLYEDLKARYHFPHKQKQLMLAINDDFADWATPLNEGDSIVYIPPVAGG